MKKNRDLQLILFFTTLWTGLLIGSLFYSGYLVINHWHLVSQPCVECVSSFAKHFFTGSQLLPLVLFIASFAVLARGFLFLRNEHLLQKKLIENPNKSAWSTGIISPIIFVNNAFWKILTKQEKAALTAHENCHIKSRHSLQFFCLGWLKAIMPIPFIAKFIDSMITKLRQKSEFEADKWAIKASSKEDLATLLYKALKFESLTESKVSAGIDTLLMQRIKSLSGVHTFKNEAMNFQPLLAFSLVLGISILSAYGAIDPLQSCL